MQTLDAWIVAAVAHEWVWRILVALGIAVVGVWLARWVARGFDRVLKRVEVEDILRNFLRNLAYAIVVIVVMVVALDYAGVPTTSVLAVLGAAGLGIGLALKDSLSNIASGVMLIVLRPFHAGDSVQVAGMEGVVESVRIFQTRLLTVDNREIILPNSQITTAPIVNYTVRGVRRVDVGLSMAFGDDLDALRVMLLGIARANREVKTEPAAEVVVTSLGEGHVSVQLRAWVDAQSHPRLQSALMEAVLSGYHARGLALPRPQREVHVFHHGGDSADVTEDMLKPAL